MVKISGVIITFNEERNIKACVESMLPVVDEIVVVDSFSTDQTKKICHEMGVRYIEHAFEGHIEQKNYAMRQAENDIILSLDADERLSEKAVNLITGIKNNWTSDGYSFNRLNNYCGKWLKNAWYPDRKLRLWDRRKGEWGGTNPHDKVLMKGSTTKLGEDILHYAYDSVEEHWDQVRKFATIAAEAKFNKSKRVHFTLHVVLNPWFKFIRKYIFQMGFLDGYYGFIYCVLASYLNFSKYVKLWELTKSAETNEK